MEGKGEAQGGVWFSTVSLLQVSEVYSLHRQTTYLAQDFFDRFMLTQEDVRKETLQLLGITALFIASKAEVSVCWEKKSIQLNVFVTVESIFCFCFYFSQIKK